MADPLKDALLEQWDEPEEDAPPGHICVAYRETATHPDRNGHIVVTEHCDCGRIVGVHDDWLL